MTITREHLEKAAKAAGLTPIDGYKYRAGEERKGVFTTTGWWNSLHDRGQLLDLAMTCKICIDPLCDQLRYYETCPGGRDKCLSVKNINCQDFPALAEAVILAACEQFDAKGGE